MGLQTQVSDVFPDPYPVEVKSVPPPDDMEAVNRPNVPVLISPEQLLSVRSDESIVAQTVHANTLFSEGCVGEDGEITVEVKEYLEELRERGVTHLYAIGLWRQSVFSRLVMPYWAKRCWSKQPDPSTIGPSCFSVQAYEPNEQIGSWENLNKFIAAAKSQGIEVAADFVTNTIAPDSEIAINNPELIEGQEIETLPEYLEEIETSDDWVSVYSREDENGTETHWDGGTQCHSLRVYRNGDHEVVVYTREDVDTEGRVLRTYEAHLSQYQGEDLSPRTTDSHVYTVLEEDGNTRVNKLSVGRQGDQPKDRMADTLMLDYREDETVVWARDLLESMAELGMTARADLAHLKSPDLWQELVPGDDTQGKLWAEVYGDYGAYLRVMDRVYNAWVIKALRRGDVAAVQASLRDVVNVQAMLEHGLLFSANHDELDEFDSRLMSGAAMAMLTSMPGGLLLAQGQIEGINDLRFSADFQIRLPDYLKMVREYIENDQSYFDFMNRLSRLWNLPVFRSSNSEVLEPHVTLQYGGCDSDLRNPRYQKVFRVARQLGEDRVMAVVNFQESVEGELIRVQDISGLFNIESLEGFCLVDLLTGEVREASNSLELETSGLGYDVHMYALVPRNKAFPPNP